MTFFTGAKPPERFDLGSMICGKRLAFGHDSRLSDILETKHLRCRQILPRISTANGREKRLIIC
jgi:hypothetical protein